MPWVFWIGMILVGSGENPAEIKDLVGRLVAPRASDRDAATDSLRRLGDAALPALNVARDATDLELRMKAAALLDAIEGDRLVRPTTITLDFNDRPLPDVLDAISLQTGMNLVLEPEGDPRWRTRRLSFPRGQPVTFWDAIDLVGKAGGIGVGQVVDSGERSNWFDPNRPRRRVRNGAVLLLRNEDASEKTPHCNSGVFRVAVQSLVVDRVRSFEGAMRGTTGDTTQFVAVIQVVAEPRVTLARLGEVRVLEAVDDLGQTLVARADLRVVPAPRIHPPNNLRAAPISIPLFYPRSPGKTIERLRGTVRAVVVGRGKDSIRFVIAEKFGVGVRHEDCIVTIHSVRPSPDGRASLVDLSVTGGDESVAWAPGRPVIGPRRGVQGPPSARGHMIFFDAKGKICGALDVGLDAIGYPSRTSIPIEASDGTGPPVEAQFFAMTWATADIDFTIRNIPMP